MICSRYQIKSQSCTECQGVTTSTVSKRLNSNLFDFVGAVEINYIHNKTIYTVRPIIE